MTTKCPCIACRVSGAIADLHARNGSASTPESLSGVLNLLAALIVQISQDDKEASRKLLAITTRLLATSVESLHMHDHDAWYTGPVGHA